MRQTKHCRLVRLTVRYQTKTFSMGLRWPYSLLCMGTYLISIKNLRSDQEQTDLAKERGSWEPTVPTPDAPPEDGVRPS